MAREHLRNPTNVGVFHARRVHELERLICSLRTREDLIQRDLAAVVHQPAFYRVIEDYT
jgi:hypothetical protein